MSAASDQSSGPWDGVSSAERKRLLCEKMASRTPAEVEQVLRRDRVLARRYGLGNHGPQDDWHDPLTAFQNSKSISAPHAQYHRWKAFFRTAAITREWDHLMDTDERSRLESLPERVVVHRGIFAEEVADQHGFSWTLDRDRAYWFAAEYWKCRFPTSNNRRPIVLTEEVDKARIIWLLLRRNENEVVLAPPLG